jgi:hypothetical protein
VYLDLLEKVLFLLSEVKIIENIWKVSKIYISNAPEGKQWQRLQCTKE